MAYADYRLCDVCGCKAFYDASLDYDFDQASGLTSLQYISDVDKQTAVICDECAKTHEVVIQKRTQP